MKIGMSKFFGGNNKWMGIIFVILICTGLLYYSSSKSFIVDNMENAVNPINNTKTITNNIITPVATNTTTSSSSYSMQPVANPSELLPIDKNSEWASLNPINSDNISSPDLLQAGYHIGLDTIGQSLKNPSYDLRSDPIIEKKEVGPWNMSTIDPDPARVPLEIGYGQR